MSTVKIKEMLLTLPGFNLPEKSDYMAWAQVVEITDCTPDHMAELVALEWLSPIETGNKEYLFRLRDVYRIQKVLRLQRDLDLTLQGATIIVDLMERIEELETEVEELRRLA